MCIKSSRDFVPPYFSIIIPMYNIESYIEKCLESILNQTEKDYEVIIVNDGSTDNGEKIANMYTSRDSRFRLICQKNSGLSMARNNGIKNAKGKYLLFVDGDDYIDAESLSNFKRICEKESVDIVMANGRRVEGDKTTLIRKGAQMHEWIKGEQYLVDKIRLNGYHPAAWLNLYSRNFIINNNLYFKKGLLHEDVEWLPRVLIKADKIVETNIIFYYYIIRPNSITTNKNRHKNGVHLTETARNLAHCMAFHDNQNTNTFLDYLANVYLNGAYIGKLEKKEIDKLFPFRNAKTARTIIKSMMFLIHPKIYYYFRRFAD